LRAYVGSATDEIQKARFYTQRADSRRCEEAWAPAFLEVKVKRALVIEDNALIAYLLQELLVESGFTAVDLAGTQAEAVSLAERWCPDLITADERLASGSGVMAIREICQVIAIPVVFIIGDAENVARSVQSALILQKPFTSSAFVAAIEEAEKYPFVWRN
jgi:CheY-like chemotaxis protein